MKIYFTNVMYIMFYIFTVITGVESVYFLINGRFIYCFVATVSTFWTYYLASTMRKELHNTPTFMQ